MHFSFHSKKILPPYIIIVIHSYNNVIIIIIIIVYCIMIMIDYNTYYTNHLVTNKHSWQCIDHRNAIIADSIIQQVNND